VTVHLPAVRASYLAGMASRRAQKGPLDRASVSAQWKMLSLALPLDPPTWDGVVPAPPSMASRLLSLPAEDGLVHVRKCPGC